MLEAGEDPASDRVFAAAGPGAAVVYHAVYERGGLDAVRDSLPNGEAWAQRLEAIPEDERDLAVHEGHLAEVNPLDDGVLPREVVPSVTLSGSAAEVREKLDGMAAAGITEVAYQPAGPDVPASLRRSWPRRRSARFRSGGASCPRPI